MFAVFTIFDYLSNVRHLINRLHGFNSSTTDSTESSCSTTTSVTTAKHGIPNSTENIIGSSNKRLEQSHDVQLQPILSNILSDNRLDYFDDDLREGLQNQEYFARELDACLLEMREIERDLYKLKQRQCYFYEQYVDFIEKKSQLVDKFLEYHEEYLSSDTNSSSFAATKSLRSQSIEYEFNIPVSNRFELLKRQHTQNFD